MPVCLAGLPLLVNHWSSLITHVKSQGKEGGRERESERYRARARGRSRASERERPAFRSSLKTHLFREAFVTLL